MEGKTRILRKCPFVPFCQDLGRRRAVPPPLWLDLRRGIKQEDGGGRKGREKVGSEPTWADEGRRGKRSFGLLAVAGQCNGQRKKALFHSLAWR